MEKNEIQKTEQNLSPLANVAALVASNKELDVDKIGKLLEIQERWQANEAKKAYVRAMSDFKTDPPEILKDKHVSYSTKGGITDYDHATLYNVTTTINAELSKHGLSASWKTSQDSGSVAVTCKISHILGHSEETSLSAPPDATGSKNAIQSIGSTVTYLQRYTLFAITGLAGKNQDDDGAGADKKPKPKPGKPTDENNRVLDAVIEKLEPAVTKNRVIDKEKLAAVFKNKAGKYPADESKIDAAAKYILELNEEDTWTVPRKFKDGLVDKSRTSDEVFKSYKKALESTVDDLHFIDRGKFNVAAEDCIVEPGDDLIAWAIKNILLEKVVEKRPF